MKKYISKYSEFALLLLVLGSISYDIYLLFRYPVAVGYDGYYYALQIISLKEQGHLYYANSYPAILYSLTILSYLIGSAIISAKIIAIILHIILCISIALIICELTNIRWLGIFGSAIAALSRLHLYYISDFISNLGGISFLLLALYLGLLWLRTRKNRFIYTSIMFLIVAIFSHKIVWFILIVLVLFAFLLRVVFLFSHPIHRIISFIIIFSSLCLAPLGIKYVSFIHQYIHINKEILNAPQWPLTNPNIVVYGALLVPLTIGLIISIRLILKGSVNIPQTLFIMIVMITVVVTLNPFLNHKLGMINITGRLFSMSYIQISFLIPGIMWLGNKYKRYIYPGAVIIILLLAYNELFGMKPTGLSTEFLANRMSLVEALPKIRSKLPINTMILANHGDEFMVTSVLGFQSQQRFPQSLENREIYWLLSQTPARLLSDDKSIIVSRDSVSGVILCKNDHLKDLLIRLNRNDRWNFIENNPHLWQIITLKRQVHNVID